MFAKRFASCYLGQVPIDLTNYEQGAPFEGDIVSALAVLQQRLARLQLAQIVHQRRAVIVIEGSEGSGKRDFVKLLGAELDPTHFTVTTILPDRRRTQDGHWLSRFWSRLPEAGYTAIFYHSWYRRVLEDKVLGRVNDKEWKRAFDEINEFESQQRDYGTLVVKLFFHITGETQDRRIVAREADEWRRHLVRPGDLRTDPARQAYRAALLKMFDQTDTRWAPWSVIDGNDQHAAQFAGLTAVAEALERGLPMAPPEIASADPPFMAAPERL